MSFGQSLDDHGAYDGYFEEDIQDVQISYISGTKNAYSISGSTITFNEVDQDTTYSISGKFRGNIIINAGDNYKLNLELNGLSLVSNVTNTIVINSGLEVILTAKKDTNNYIYNTRSAIDSTDDTLYSGAIHSMVDLELDGKGSLVIISENNNGVHTKDDLQVNNLTLLVACVDNALKGNDSVEITAGTTTLIATGGDGIDASYDVVVEDVSTILNIFTDKYSNYSGEVTDNSDSLYRIMFTGSAYSYSIKYYNSNTDFQWVNATYDTMQTSGWTTYFYYTFPKLTQYSKMQVYVYSKGQEQGQESSYYACSELMELNTAYDTISITSKNGMVNFGWTSYTTTPQNNNNGWGGGPGGMGVPGGMGGGNSKKGDHSTKGIKAGNQILIANGTISIKSYDDCLHANNETALENGKSPLGDINTSGGSLALYSNDDGIHGDNKVTISAGIVNISHSYEGIEGAQVCIDGGNVSIVASDDGINGTGNSGTAIAISGGQPYIYCNGDGIDSNSRQSYKSITFSGGNTVIISTSSGNSSIDAEGGYSYTGGSVVAMCPQGGMSNESTRGQNFQSYGKSSKLSLNLGSYLVVSICDQTATIQMPTSLSALVVVLGDKNANIKTSNSIDVTLDDNGVAWN